MCVSKPFLKALFFFFFFNGNKMPLEILLFNSSSFPPFLFFFLSVLVICRNCNKTLCGCVNTSYISSISYINTNHNLFSWGAFLDKNEEVVCSFGLQYVCLFRSLLVGREIIIVDRAFS